MMTQGTPPALLLRDVKKVYSNGFTAVQDIDLTVNQGDFYALLGPNGAGKSTIIGMISSLVRKSSGKIEVLGWDIDEDFREAKKRLGVVAQEFNFDIFNTCINIVRDHAGFYNFPKKEAHERALSCLDLLGLSNKRNEIFWSLSGGMKRRLMIACAIVHDPSLLILDEPTAGVDIHIRHSIWNFLRQINEQGTTIILTTHYLEEAEQLCQRLGVINHGKLIYENDMSAVRDEMHGTIFTLDIEPTKVDSARIDGFALTQVNDSTLEVLASTGQALNKLFLQLDAMGVTVLSVRNKVSRLEELFLQLVAD